MFDYTCFVLPCPELSACYATCILLGHVEGKSDREPLYCPKLVKLAESELSKHVSLQESNKQNDAKVGC